MTHTYIEDIGKYVGGEVTLRGWVHNKRSSGKIQFLIVRDGTGYIQAVVAKNAVSPEIFSAADSLTHESSLAVTGTVRQDSRAPSGFELDVTDLKVYQEVSKEEPFPITPKEHGIDFLMDQRHLWIRSTRQRAILKIRHEIIKAVRDFFDNDGFTLCDTPILTPAACEGTSTLFEVKYFDETAFLTQSGQLYNEATAEALGKVYCFGPTFRAEKSKTRRHLTEFWMVEPEVAFATLDNVLNLAERFLSYIADRVITERGEELKTLERDVAKLEAIVPPFPRLHYDDAVRMLHAGHAAGEVETRFEWGGDF